MYAKKAVINYCGIELEGYQLPNGSYTLSQSQVALAIEKSESSFRSFLQSGEIKASPSSDHSDLIIAVINTEGVGRPFKAVPIKLAAMYWTYWAKKGNVKAQALIAVGAVESLTRLFDNAFGVAKTEQQYQADSTQSRKEFEIVLTVMQRLEQKIDSMETELKLLRPAYQELQTLNKSFSQLTQLKPLLEEIAKRIDVPNQKEDTIRGWLAKLNLNQAVSNKQAQLIGRLIADWLKIGNLQAPKGKPSRYPEAMVPLIKLATEYQLFYA